MPDAAVGNREARDVDPRVVVVFAVGLIGFLALALTLLRLIFGALPSPLPFGAGMGLDGSRGPVLQTDPKADRAAYDAEKAAELNGLDWVDRAAGIAHIPITDALRIVAEQGLPDFGRTAAPTGTAGPGTADACALLAQNVPRAPQCPPPAEPPAAAGGAR